MPLNLSRQQFELACGDLLNHPKVLLMKEYIQHGGISTYDHVCSVGSCAFALKECLKLRVDEKALAAATLLHDFYLYDWHDAPINVPLFQMHGFTHPAKASKNAKEILGMNEKICRDIRSHMWPLTLFCIPVSKEGWLLCIADKWCATKETLKIK